MESSKDLENVHTSHGLPHDEIEPMLQNMNTYYVFPKLLREKQEDQWKTTSACIDQCPHIVLKKNIDQIPNDLRNSIIANMIVECEVTKVKRNHKNKIEKISAQYIKTISICHSGKHLYQDKHPLYVGKDSTQGIDMDVFKTEYSKKHRELIKLNPSIYCIIDKDRYIYDKEMPHLSYEIEEVSIGDKLIGMVVDNRLESVDNPRLVLTLQNSKISGAQQLAMDYEETEQLQCREHRTFYKLGISSKKIKEQGIIESKFYSLDQLMNEAGINQYSTLNYKEDHQIYNFQEIGFNSTKLRDAQNLDWSEDSVYQGLQYEMENNELGVEQDFNKALEFYTNAIELDPLNKQAFQAKGFLLKKLERYEEAEEALKQALRLDPEDSEIEDLLQQVMLTNRSKHYQETRRKEEEDEVPIKTDIEIKHMDVMIKQSHQQLSKQKGEQVNFGAGKQQYQFEF